MVIETHRFGRLDVDETRLITFREGILGFADRRVFALIQTSPDPVFYWLQSVEDPTLAFLVCDPRSFVADYQVPVKRDDMEALGLRSLDDSLVLVIVNKVDGWLTGNLLGPLVIGSGSRLARQLVLSDKRYDTRQRLMPVPAPQVVAKTA